MPGRDRGGSVRFRADPGQTEIGALADHQTFHFLSGLPRAGSTLTAAIPRWYPRFHAGMSSPVAALFEGLIAQVSAGTELSSMVDPDQRARMLRDLSSSYCSDRADPEIFDTNRAWTAKLPTLMQLVPEARLVCLVRDVAWIVDSMERRFRAHAVEHTRLFNTPGERATVHARTEAPAGANRLVGFAWHALREACHSEFADRPVIVARDLLVARPAEVFKLLYEFLGEAPFAHDFVAIDHDAPALDAQLGLVGLHRVCPSVEARPRQTAPDHPAAGPLRQACAARLLARYAEPAGLSHRRPADRAGAAPDDALGRRRDRRR